jgi:hypothetical protein
MKKRRIIQPIQWTWRSTGPVTGAGSLWPNENETIGPTFIHHCFREKVKTMTNKMIIYLFIFGGEISYLGNNRKSTAKRPFFFWGAKVAIF